MGHNESFGARGFIISWIFYRFLGVQRDPSRCSTSSPFWDPRKPALRWFFFIFSNTGCRGIIQGRTPQILVVNLDQLVLEFSCSRQRRSQNAIFILKSSSLRFHRRTARFIAQTRNPSRRFEELDPEPLHKCSMDHHESFDGRRFSIAWLFYRFSGVQRDSSRISK